MKTVTLQLTLTSCSSDPYILSTALLCTIRVVWQFFASAALTWTCAIGFYLLHVLFSKVKSSTPKGLSWIKWAHILCWGIASGNSMLPASSRLQYNTHCYPLWSISVEDFALAFALQPQPGNCFPREPIHFIVWFGSILLSFCLITVCMVNHLPCSLCIYLFVFSCAKTITFNLPPLLSSSFPFSSLLTPVQLAVMRKYYKTFRTLGVPSSPPGPTSRNLGHEYLGNPISNGRKSSYARNKASEVSRSPSRKLSENRYRALFTVPVPFKLVMYLSVFLICWGFDFVEFLLGDFMGCYNFPFTVVYYFTVNLQGALNFLVYGLTNKELRNNYTLISGSIQLFLSPFLIGPYFILFLSRKCIEKCCEAGENKGETSGLLITTWQAVCFILSPPTQKKRSLCISLKRFGVWINPVLSKDKNNFLAGRAGTPIWIELQFFRMASILPHELAAGAKSPNLMYIQRQAGPRNLTLFFLPLSITVNIYL